MSEQQPVRYGSIHPRHWHLTRDVKPRGECLACDLSWKAMDEAEQSRTGRVVAVGAVKHASCPFCGAKPGELCVTRHGKRPKEGTHMARVHAMHRQEKEQASAGG